MGKPSLTLVEPAHLGALGFDAAWVRGASPWGSSGHGRRHAVRRHEGRTFWLTIVDGGFDEGDAQRFVNSAVRRAAFQHANALPMVAAGRLDELLYVVFDTGGAAPLVHRLSHHQGLPEEQALKALRDVAAVVDAASAAGLTPAELTPESVFLKPGAGTLVGDLGVARDSLGPPRWGTDLCRPYLPPEATRRQPLPPLSAVYSFGALAYTILTGRRPPEGGTGELFTARLSDDLPKLTELRPDVARELGAVLARAMATSPGDRYASAAEVAAALAAACTAPRPAAASPKRGRSHVLAGRIAARRVRRAPPAPPPLAASTPRPKASAASLAPSPPQAPARFRRSFADRPNAVVQTGRWASPRLDTIVACGAALAAGTFAGVLITANDDAKPTSARAAAGGVTVEVPEGWTRRPQNAEDAARILSLGAPGGSGGLVVDDARIGAALPDGAVAGRLGNLDAWRLAASESGVSTVRHFVPTASGWLALVCFASPDAPTGSLQACERVAATLTLGRARQPISGRDATLRADTVAALNRLRAARTAGRLRLARAERRRGQATAGRALATAYADATERVAGQPVAAPLRDAAGAYRDLARAAEKGDAAAFESATKEVRAAERGVVSAMGD